MGPKDVLKPEQESLIKEQGDRIKNHSSLVGYTQGILSCPTLGLEFHQLPTQYYHSYHVSQPKESLEQGPRLDSYRDKGLCCTVMSLRYIETPYRQVDKMKWAFMEADAMVKSGRSEELLHWLDPDANTSQETFWDELLYNTLYELVSNLDADEEESPVIDAIFNPKISCEFMPPSLPLIAMAVVATNEGLTPEEIATFIKLWTQNKG